MCVAHSWPQSLDMRDCAALGIRGLYEGGNGSQGGCMLHLTHKCSQVPGYLQKSLGMNSFTNRSFLLQGESLFVKGDFHILLFLKLVSKKVENLGNSHSFHKYSWSPSHVPSAVPGSWVLGGSGPTGARQR